MLTDLYVFAEKWRQKFDLRDCGLLFGRVRGHLQSCCAFLWLGTLTHIMSTLGHSSPIWAHHAQAQRMPSSHDAKGSIQMDMCSLGVVDLDLSISPDAFGLRAFDHEKPLTRMLPRSMPCELQLMLPDSALGSDGFHDILVDNLAASTTWRSGHVLPADMTALSRRWPRAVFRTMDRHGQDMERLRQGARQRPDRAFRQNAPGFCPVCEVWIESALDVHMLNFQLELAQLWHCPVQWYAVWKGSVRACLEHLSEKHGGSSLFALKNVSKYFPPWTVSHNVWQTALRPDVSGIAVDARLFHEAGCRLVHRYCVHKDTFPRPALRGVSFLTFCPV